MRGWSVYVDCLGVGVRLLLRVALGMEKGKLLVCSLPFFDLGAVGGGYLSRLLL